MKNNKQIWIYGLLATLAIIIVPVIVFIPKASASTDDPWKNVPQKAIHTDHKDIVQGPFETGSDVTEACLKCHQDAAFQVMGTSHWTWESKPIQLPGRDEPVTVGKKNQINNFCIGIQGNWQKCVTCHAGYGWEDETFHDTATENTS